VQRGLMFLASALGVSDGRVYEALWRNAQTEPLNRDEVPDGYEVCFKVLYVREPLKY
jgi:acyl-CoA oxidase